MLTYKVSAASPARWRRKPRDQFTKEVSSAKRSGMRTERHSSGTGLSMNVQAARCVKCKRAAEIEQQPLI
jgi:hypothetical protein